MSINRSKITLASGRGIAAQIRSSGACYEQQDETCQRGNAGHVERWGKSMPDLKVEIGHVPAGDRIGGGFDQWLSQEGHNPDQYDQHDKQCWRCP